MGRSEEGESRLRSAGRKITARYKRKEGAGRLASRREKRETRVGGIGEEKREQIMQPGETVATLEVRERVL